MLIVFDLDGTLANLDHRLGYVRTKPKNWKAFEAGILRDSLNEKVAEVLYALRNEGHDIVFASGRSDSSREQTKEWLEKHDLWTLSTHLYMRKEGDYRSDVIVKREILDLIVSGFGKKPDMVFDDRPGVVQMWRDEGIFVFDVYQGTEDF